MLSGDLPARPLRIPRPPRPRTALPAAARWRPVRVARGAASVALGGLLCLAASCSLMAPSDEEISGSCSDGIRNGGESDVDCGGPASLGCRSCDVGYSCGQGSDCTSGVCSAAVCAKGDCHDDLQNGDESDVDCGGQVCDPCNTGKKCQGDFDCEYYCVEGVCVIDPCGDGIRNGNETDIDCGGIDCDYCQAGQDCLVPDDCDATCVDGVCQ